MCTRARERGGSAGGRGAAGSELTGSNLRRVYSSGTGGAAARGARGAPRQSSGRRRERWALIRGATAAPTRGRSKAALQRNPPSSCSTRSPEARAAQPRGIQANVSA